MSSLSPPPPLPQLVRHPLGEPSAFARLVSRPLECGSRRQAEAAWDLLREARPPRPGARAPPPARPAAPLPSPPLPPQYRALAACAPFIRPTGAHAADVAQPPPHTQVLTPLMWRNTKREAAEEHELPRRRLRASRLAFPASVSSNVLCAGVGWGVTCLKKVEGLPAGLQPAAGGSKTPWQVTPPPPQQLLPCQ